MSDSWAPRSQRLQESEPDAETGMVIARTDNYIPVRVVSQGARGLFDVKLRNICQDGIVDAV